MNKRIKFIMPILCGVLLSSSLAFTNVQAAAIHESNATISTAYEKDMSNSHFDENVEIKEITREEYLKTYAEKRGVSIEEADRLEKLETEKSIKDEISTKASRSNVDPIALSADIFGDTGYGNKMKMMLSANVVHEISVSLSGTAKRAGFDISGGIGGPYYARKYVSLNDTFSSNWDLS